MIYKNYLLVITIFLTLLSISFCSTGENTTSNGSKDLEKVEFSEFDYSFANPERGFYIYNFFSTENNNVLTADEIRRHRSNGFTLMQNLYHLKGFIDKPISRDFLARIEANLTALRQGGAKAILRFSYSDSQEEKPWDPPIDIVLKHIEQLKPIFIEYSDVIYTLEAGFIGAWGEWYYTDNFVMDPEAKEDFKLRRKVLESLLEALPKNRMICVRTPSFKLNLLDINVSDSITESKAYNESTLSRIGSHNDCFLSSSNDQGTFSSLSEREYWQNESKYTIMGGETCAPSTYSECENTISEMEKYHWSYLNSGYHPIVLNEWKESGCFEEINSRLGYRFLIKEIEYTKSINNNESFTINASIKNDGFASLMNPRNLELIIESIENQQEIYVKELNYDPRNWESGVISKINASFKVTEGMSGKEFNVYFNLKDPSNNLKENSDFSIRFANKDMWDSKTGYNHICTFNVR